MMQADDHFEQLMDYLTNRMPPDERRAFEVELITNQALREALETERQLHNGLLSQKIREQLSQIHEQLMAEGAIGEPESAPIRQLPVWRSYGGYAAIAASVVLIGGLSIYLFRQETKPVKPVAVQSKPKPSVPIEQKPVAVKPPKTAPTLSPKKTVPVPEKESIQPEPPTELLAYNAFQKLTKTLPVETQLATEETDTRGERTEAEELADGRLLLQQGSSAEAIAALKLLAQSPSTTEWPQWAQWYLAGAYLRARQLGEARLLLTKISNTPTHPCKAVAKKLLLKIK